MNTGPGVRRGRASALGCLDMFREATQRPHGTAGAIEAARTCRPSEEGEDPPLLASQRACLPLLGGAHSWRGHFGPAGKRARRRAAVSWRAATASEVAGDPYPLCTSTSQYSAVLAKRCTVRFRRERCKGACIPSLKRSASSSKPHHRLDHRLACLGDFALLSCPVGAIFAEFFRPAPNLHALEHVDLVATTFAHGHRIPPSTR